MSTAQTVLEWGLKLHVGAVCGLSAGLVVFYGLHAIKRWVNTRARDGSHRQ